MKPERVEYLIGISDATPLVEIRADLGSRSDRLGPGARAWALGSRQKHLKGREPGEVEGEGPGRDYGPGWEVEQANGPWGARQGSLGPARGYLSSSQCPASSSEIR